MNLKRFFRCLLLIVSLVSCKSSDRGAAIKNGEAKGPLGEVRAIWLTHVDFLNKSEKDLESLANRLQSANLNTVYFGVYSKSLAMWPSPTMRAAGGETTAESWPEKLCRIFHAHGFWVGAWFEYGLAGGTAASKIVQAHPEWWQRSEAGKGESPENGGFYFFSPNHPEVKEFIKSLLTELARMDFDEIQFDRFRWTASSTKGVTDFGYEEATLQPYLKKYKQPPTARPKPDSAPWIEWRRAGLNRFVETMSGAIRAANPKIVISASPVGYYGVRHFLQDWRHWLLKSYIDVVFPQLYADNLPDFAKNVAEILRLMSELKIQNKKKDRRVGAGILWNGSAPLGVAQKFMAMLRRAGIHDIALWPYQLEKGKTGASLEPKAVNSQTVLWRLPSVNPRSPQDSVDSGDVIVDEPSSPDRGPPVEAPVREPSEAPPAVPKGVPTSSPPASSVDNFLDPAILDNLDWSKLENMPWKWDPLKFPLDWTIEPLAETSAFGNWESLPSLWPASQ